MPGPTLGTDGPDTLVGGAGPDTLQGGPAATRCWAGRVPIS
nr:hypothetical protein [Aureimonas sp. Leaf324]